MAKKSKKPTDTIFWKIIMGLVLISFFSTPILIFFSLIAQSVNPPQTQQIQLSPEEIQQLLESAEVQTEPFGAESSSSAASN
jgi:hypothetical protein